MTKYQTALDLMNAVIAVKHDIDLIATSWDQLYSYIHEHFEAPASMSYPIFHTKKSDMPAEIAQEIQDCYAMLRVHNETEVLARLAAIPPEYSDTIFPVAIARYLILYQKVFPRVEMLKTFKEFHKRYGPAVCAADEFKTKKS